MGTKRSHINWTTTQERDLRKLWVSDKSIKANLHLFGDHTYQAVIAHAQNLKLGKRPRPVRSTYSAVWDEVRRLLESRMRLTAGEIAERLGFSHRHVTDILNVRHDEDESVIHIHAWKRAGQSGQWVPVWAWGDGDDAKKPRARTKDDINRMRREKRAVRIAARKAGPFGVAMNQIIQEAA